MCKSQTYCPDKRVSSRCGSNSVQNHRNPFWAATEYWESELLGQHRRPQSWYTYHPRNQRLLTSMKCESDYQKSPTLSDPWERSVWTNDGCQRTQQSCCLEHDRYSFLQLQKQTHTLLRSLPIWRISFYRGRFSYIHTSWPSLRSRLGICRPSRSSRLLVWASSQVSQTLEVQQILSEPYIKSIATFLCLSTSCSGLFTPASWASLWSH